VRDIAPPAAPSGIAALLIGAEVEVSWSPSPEPDLAGYRVYRARRGGEPRRVGEVSPGETVFREPAPDSDTVVLYTVTAVDGAGNESSPSAPARVQPQ
jgi:penicillin-binding protein